MEWMLVVVRGLFLCIIEWNIWVDYKLKGRISLEKFTVWGEISTLAAFLLLLVCSIAKASRK